MNHDGGGAMMGEGLLFVTVFVLILGVVGLLCSRLVAPTRSRKLDEGWSLIRRRLAASPPLRLAALLFRPYHPDADITEGVQWLTTERDRLRDIVLGSHAIRCTCGDHMRAMAAARRGDPRGRGQWDTRDPRCIEIQALAAPQPDMHHEAGS